MAKVAPSNDRLMPWYIGIVIIITAVIFVGYQMWATSCPAPTFIEIGVLTVIPVVYLALPSAAVRHSQIRFNDCCASAYLLAVGQACSLLPPRAHAKR